MTDRSASAPGRSTSETVARALLRPTLAATALLALTVSAAVPLHAASFRLSQGLPFSDVSSAPPPQLSPDGRYIVYVHDAVIDHAGELWSVPVAGGDPVRLSGLLPSGSAVQTFAITPDSQRVVYVAAQDTAGVFEIYSAPIAGPEGSWTKLNPPLVSGGDVSSSFTIAPDGNRVAFVADVQTDEVRDVWSVPVEGGPALKHRPAVTVAGSSVPHSAPEISADGERVLFMANFQNLEKQELWSARLDGTGGIAKLNGALVSGGDVLTFAISPDSAHVVYRADQQVDERDEIYSVPVAGGTPVKLNGSLVSGGQVFPTFAISQNSSRVVYYADQEVHGRYEIYSVPLAGGTAIKLNGALVSGRDVGPAFAISPDSSRVVYLADQQTDEVWELYSVPLAGGVAVKLNGALVSGGEVLSIFVISPDSSRVVYHSDQQTDNVLEIYSVPLAGGAVVKVSDSLVAGGGVWSFAITLDSDFVLYRADKDVDERRELFRGSILGGTSTDERVSGSMVPNGDVAPSFVLHPDGLRVGYVADQEVDERIDLYIGDPCILCDGFEGGNLLRWE